ncbi:MAG: hypothetical protein A2Y17_12585 [Clostridiales bacterium GWF2_38_85]|nr:MAG: hypothetical protein A2Y17_12585 [Clostridiales bacterium GWF2_38_85]HBL84095.1 undecaprenyl-phosphate alpha-N-acetylglucosaminyl 1-phosphate transferase [Clostridiales bacterium]
MNIKLFFLLLSILLLIGLLSFLLTLLVIPLAKHFKAYDKDDKRHSVNGIKLRMGGLSIFISFSIFIIIIGGFSPLINSILIGGLSIIVIGMIDDIYGITPYIKLTLLLGSSIIPVLFGVRIEWFNLFGNYITFGIWSIPITIIWVLILTNAMNLIDGLDGLACGISVISALTLTVIAFIMNVTDIALITLCLCGASLGFYPLNKVPAKITLGDTGALFLGYTFAVISIEGLFKTSAIVSYLIPVIIFSLPIFDVFFSILRRSIRKSSIVLADRDHLHYRMIDFGIKQSKTVEILHIFSIVNSIGAVLLALGKYVSGLLIIFISSASLIIIYVFLRKERIDAKADVCLRNSSGSNKTG